MNIAQAKRKGHKSYLGLIYLAKLESGNSVTIIKVWETNQSLSKPPLIPSLPKNISKSTDIKPP